MQNRPRVLQKLPSIPGLLCLLVCLTAASIQALAEKVPDFLAKSALQYKFLVASSNLPPCGATPLFMTKRRAFSVSYKELLSAL